VSLSIISLSALTIYYFISSPNNNNHLKEQPQLIQGDNNNVIQGDNNVINNTSPASPNYFVDSTMNSGFVDFIERFTGKIVRIDVAIRCVGCYGTSTPEVPLDADGMVTDSIIVSEFRKFREHSAPNVSGGDVQFLDFLVARRLGNDVDGYSKKYYDRAAGWIFRLKVDKKDQGAIVLNKYQDKFYISGFFKVKPTPSNANFFRVFELQSLTVN
jgi:hypothetical protein